MSPSSRDKRLRAPARIVRGREELARLAAWNPDLVREASALFDALPMMEIGVCAHERNRGDGMVCGMHPDAGFLCVACWSAHREEAIEVCLHCGEPLAENEVATVLVGSLERVCEVAPGGGIFETSRYVLASFDACGVCVATLWLARRETGWEGAHP